MLLSFLRRCFTPMRVNSKKSSRSLKLYRLSFRILRKKTKLKNVVPSFRKAGIHPSQEKNAWAEVQLKLFMKNFMSPILVKGAQKRGFPHLKELLYVKSRMVSNDLNYGDDVTAYDLIVLLGLVQRRMGRQGIQKILGLALS